MLTSNLFRDFKAISSSRTPKLLSGVSPFLPGSSSNLANFFLLFTLRLCNVFLPLLGLVPLHVPLEEILPLEYLATLLHTTDKDLRLGFAVTIFFGSPTAGHTEHRPGPPVNSVLPFFHCETGVTGTSGITGC